MCDGKTARDVIVARMAQLNADPALRGRVAVLARERIDELRATLKAIDKACEGSD